ncbi:translation elongation factor Ts (EF-Ts) [Luteococcus japonicus]|uniref:Elongation factor Ts n=1 Tax=Luteococcus japonicus TaxID=33984 RepID=A0A3N1ZY82_9ACTN|nr:translation elongation factor Ts [Luteococcus japonicus]ROR55708.1 translation elongation factor Ts (EF-Ts) [Luteococcus japonicus]
MAITAADVKKLRDATGAGMMDAKKALTEAEGDFERAVEILRVTGQAKMAKRSDREASNGIVAASGKSLIQLGSETDFVAKNGEFIALADKVVAAVAAAGANGVEAANAVALEDGTVQSAIEALATKIGEKLELKDAVSYEGNTHTYLHRRSQDLPPQVGVLVEYTGEDEALVHSVALQIASMQPQFVKREDVPAELVEKEARIAKETALEEGKPEKILDRIVEGRLGGFYKDVCLVEQPAVSDDKKTVGQLLDAAGVVVTRFARLSAGA